jgi:hypothetical protein
MSHANDSKDQSSDSGSRHTEQEDLERARTRMLWRESIEYRRSIKALKIITTVVAVLIIMVGVASGMVIVSRPESERIEDIFSDPSLWPPLVIATILAYGGTFLWMYIHTVQRRNFRERQLLGLSESIQEDERELATSGNDLELGSAARLGDRL